MGSLSRIYHPPSLSNSRQRLLRAMWRFEQWLVKRVIVANRPCTEAEERQVRELAIEQDWDGQIHRLRMTELNAQREHPLTLASSRSEEGD